MIQTTVIRLVQSALRSLQYVALLYVGESSFAQDVFDCCGSGFNHEGHLCSRLELAGQLVTLNLTINQRIVFSLDATIMMGLCWVIAWLYAKGNFGCVWVLIYLGFACKQTLL